MNPAATSQSEILPDIKFRSCRGKSRFVNQGCGGGRAARLEPCCAQATPACRAFCASWPGCPSRRACERRPCRSPGAFRLDCWLQRSTPVGGEQPSLQSTGKSVSPDQPPSCSAGGGCQLLSPQRRPHGDFWPVFRRLRRARPNEPARSCLKAAKRLLTRRRMQIRRAFAGTIAG